MTRCPPKSTRPDTLFPDPTLFLSVSRIDFENQHRAHLDEEARLHELAAERATLGGQVADNQAAIRQAPIDLGRTLADLSSRGMELDQRRLDIAGTRSIVLTAPIDGQVAALQSRDGQAVGQIGREHV